MKIIIFILSHSFFYKLYILPFGIQTTQIHLNYWSIEDYKKFENFVKKNVSNIINYDEALSKSSNQLQNKILKILWLRI